MEFKEGMVFRCKNKYYVLALIQSDQYLILSDDENCGWDLHDSPNYEQIINSKAYNGYVPLHNGKECKFATGWWYGASFMRTFTYVDNLNEVHDDPAVKRCIFMAHLGEIAALHAGRRGAAPYNATK